MRYWIVNGNIHTAVTPEVLQADILIENGFLPRNVKKTKNLIQERVIKNEQGSKKHNAKIKLKIFFFMFPPIFFSGFIIALKKTFVKQYLKIYFYKFYNFSQQKPHKIVELLFF